jgi:hypothetical protein
VRPVAGAPVSMPLVWEDIVPQLDARQSHLRDALEPEASPANAAAPNSSTRSPARAASSPLASEDVGAEHGHRRTRVQSPTSSAPPELKQW